MRNLTTRVGRLDGSARMVDSGASLAAMKNGAAVHEAAIGVGVLTAAKQVSEHGRAIRRADRAIAGRNGQADGRGLQGGAA